MGDWHLNAQIRPETIRRGSRLTSTAMGLLLTAGLQKLLSVCFEEHCESVVLGDCKGREVKGEQG